MKFKRYPKYKNSGFEWIDNVPEAWGIKRLKYICSQSAVYGANIKSEDYTLQGVRFLRTTDITEDGGLIPEEDAVYVDREMVREYMLENGDILFSRSGTLGRCYLFDKEKFGDCSYAGYLVKFKIDPNNLPEYIFYYSKSKSFDAWMKMIAIESTIGNINGQKYANIFLPVPSKDSQKDIILFLDAETSRIFGLINQYGKLIEQLKEKRTSLISHVVTKGLNPNAKMKNSGVEWIGEIPAHWKIRRLKFCLPYNGNAIKPGPFGSQLKSSDMEFGDIKVYNQKSVIEQDTKAGENYISKEKYKELIAFETFPGDILLTSRGTIGRCLILPHDAEKGILHPCLIRIQVNNQLISKEYLSLVLQDANFIKDQLLVLSCATTIEVIYSSDLREINIPIPPSEEQKQILHYLNQETSKIDNLVEKINKQIELLNEYKTSLISHAVTGKIDVREEITCQ